MKNNMYRKLSEEEIQQIAHFAAQRGMTTNPTTNVEACAEAYYKSYQIAKDRLNDLNNLGG